MAVLRANVEFAKRILRDRIGNDYVYGGNWNPNDTSVGTDCSGLVIDICDAVRNGTRMAWSRHGMSTETWRSVEVGDTGTIFNTVCVASPADFPADAAVKIALHHGPGGGANSHMWCEVDGMRGESNGSDGCVTGTDALSVYNTSYANDWHYIPGPITDSGSAPPPQLSRSDQYALTIIEVGRQRNITERGQKIALATALVESNLKNYANSKVPESLRLPHDAVGSDGYSVGVFQQQVVMGQYGWWWGDAATCMDVAKSAGLFYDRLARLDYNGPNSPGSYAQAVQSSAFPDRYDERYPEAMQLFNRLANLSSTLDPITELLMSDLQVESLSIYATPGEPLIPIVRMVQSIDAADHRELVESAARLGDVDSLQRIARTAAGQGKFKDAATVAHAKAVLADIEANTPNVLKNYLATKGQ